MKKYINLFFVSAFLLTSCLSTNFVSGVGEPVTEEFILDEFDSFKLLDISM